MSNQMTMDEITTSTTEVIMEKEIVEIRITDEDRLKLRNAELVFGKASTLQITNAAEHQNAISFLKLVKGDVFDVEALRVSIKAPILEAGRRLDELFRAPIESLKNAQKIVNTSILGFENEQERLRQIEELKMRAKVEQEEIEARKKLEIKAEKAEQKGLVEKAEELKEMAKDLTFVKTSIPLGFDKAKGRRRTYYAEVIDLSLLPTDYRIITANQKVLNALAQSTEGKAVIPGVRMYYEETLTTRR